MSRMSHHAWPLQIISTTLVKGRYANGSSRSERTQDLHGHRTQHSSWRQTSMWNADRGREHMHMSLLGWDDHPSQRRYQCWITRHGTQGSQSWGHHLVGGCVAPSGTIVCRGPNFDWYCGSGSSTWVYLRLWTWFRTGAWRSCHLLVRGHSRHQTRTTDVCYHRWWSSLSMIQLQSWKLTWVPEVSFLRMVFERYGIRAHRDFS